MNKLKELLDGKTPTPAVIQSLTRKNDIYILQTAKNTFITAVEPTNEMTQLQSAFNLDTGSYVDDGYINPAFIVSFHKL